MKQFNLYRILTVGLLFIFLSLMVVYEASAQCPQADFSPSANYLCSGDTVYFTNFSLDSCATDTTWYFGDGTTSNASNPQHVYYASNDTMVYVRLCYDGGAVCHIDSLFITRDCVWPGDANNDGIVNNYDLLHIGLAYNDTGPQRPITSIEWWGQYAKNWNREFPNGINYKHADCNGNSVVNAQDTLAIIANYKKTHNKKEGEISGSPTDPLLYFDFPVDSVQAGQEVVVDIKLGTDSVPANNVYGLAMCADYDAALVDSGKVSLSLSGSQLGPRNKLVRLSKNFPMSGQTEIGMVRTDQLNTATNGKIGQFTIVMEDDLSAKDSLISQPFDLSFCDATLVSNTMSTLSIRSRSDTVEVYQDLDSRSDEFSENITLQLRPNPVDERLMISTPGHRLKRVRIYNLLGHLEKDYSNTSLHKRVTLPTRSLKTGLYFVQVITTGGVVSRKMEIVH